MPLVGKVVDQRFASAVDAVAWLRSQEPAADPDDLVDRLIRRCARDLAIGGAVAGGAAASPGAGAAALAAGVGADATYSLGRLSELIVSIGLVYGHDQHAPDDRTAAVLAVLGLSEGAAIGLTGIAARVGSRGGARLVARLPGAERRPSAAQRAMAKLSTSKGPWSLAALLPYGIGAGVGAAGNAVLAATIGSAARQYFSALPPPRHEAILEDAGEGDLLEDEPLQPRPSARRFDDSDIVDAVIVDAVIVERVNVRSTRK